jgi:hypothetical protein
MDLTLREVERVAMIGNARTRQNLYNPRRDMKIDNMSEPLYVNNGALIKEWKLRMKKRKDKPTKDPHIKWEQKQEKLRTETKGLKPHEAIAREQAKKQKRIMQHQMMPYAVQ